MAVYKDGDKWRVIYRYTNYKGERKQTQKRGFATKREAVAWEHEVMLKSESKLDMTFASFFEIYEEDKKKRVKENTWESKSHVIRTKILPYFGERKIAEIEPRDVIAWQNEILAYKGENGEVYSPAYLKTIHAQLSAIFNHAIRYYHLPSNPAQKAGSMGSEEHKEMLFWTKEEYLKFADVMMDAVYETTDRKFWTELARCNQEEFKKSGTEGTCIEARELIIALPESFVDYEPDKLFKLFTEHFRQNYGVECISALHHNKRKKLNMQIISRQL